MTGPVKITITAAIVLAAAAAAIVLNRLRLPVVESISGAVLRQDTDPRKQIPVPDAQVIVSDGSLTTSATSGPSGLFHVNLPPGIRRGDPITVGLRHSGYHPLDISEQAGDRLFILRMTPLPQPPARPPAKPEVAISNVRLRYAVSATSIVNVGSAVKTFEVVNKGNVPCEGRDPCSPDGKWKASIGGTTLDAGDGNQFQGARVTCIAGPCPFTKIERDEFSAGGKKIAVSVRDWSDTTSFLMEAEVVRPLISDLVRRAYPVIFGRSMSFTLPASAQGLSIEADIGGSEIAFPLGPTLTLSWAQCRVQTVSEGIKIYGCDLKNGYRFQ